MNKSKRLNVEIKNLLYKLGIRINFKGYGLIKYALQELYNKPDLHMQELYLKVSERFGITMSSVERAIRYAVVISYEDIEKYFGVKYKITNAAFLRLALEDILEKMEGEINVRRSFKTNKCKFRKDSRCNGKRSTCKNNKKKK